MRRYRFILLLIAILELAAQPAFAAPDPAQTFRRLWQRNDAPVAAGRADRSWTWGPGPNTAPLFEQYTDPRLPEGSRVVQYFDKGRMELNDPAADPSSPWFVTSGLLPRELMTGSQQLGDTVFAAPRDSYLAAIGDPGSFPAYPDLLPLYESPGTVDPAEIGKPAVDLLGQDLRISSFADYAADPATVLVQGPNNHGVPRAFVDFQQQRGLIMDGGRATQGQVFDPLFVFGLPITPAVWVYTRIGGAVQPVLFQVFERRVLTYNPAHPAAFRVEMGNVGQHYHRWRYQPEQVSEWDAWDWNTRTVAASDGGSYTLEVDVATGDSGSPAPPRKSARYRIFYAPAASAPRELRSSGATEACYIVNVALLAPSFADAAPGRLGLATQCADNPSQSRGAGVLIRSSYDGGKTFVERSRS